MGGKKRDKCPMNFVINPRELAVGGHQQKMDTRKDEGLVLLYNIQLEPRRQHRAPIHSPLGPRRLTTYPSIARSGRGKGKEKKKKLGPSIPGMRFLLPLDWGRAGRPRRGGEGGGRRGPSPGRALRPARAPAWPSRCSGKPSPAFGAGRNFPGKSRTRRSAVRGEGGEEGAPDPIWPGRGCPEAPRRDH